ncbi:class I SAM-dependent methyltransferase [Paenibacillus sp. GCM10023252]|uniref:class I SAM-dependent methyltransferase n=1 Tax=Paenibacillus sp. GCM10023252 TaxID=3252649 RepID=UPI003605BEDE
MDVINRNISSWNEKVNSGSPWSIPVSSEVIQKAKEGVWEITVTATKPVPRGWFPSLQGKTILCLASGGGQQGPVLAAAGGNVTVLDFSEGQLKQDRLVAEREGLTINTVLGDMTDLSEFADEQFDLIIHPVSNLYIPDIEVVWNQAYRIIRTGGTLISGFMNPVFYLFDWSLQEQGVLQVKHPLPYSDLEYLADHEEGAAIEFGHTLEAQIQGQLSAGFVINGFYEDTYGGERLLDTYTSSFLATRAVK